MVHAERHRLHAARMADMSAPSLPLYHVRFPNGGRTNDSTYASAATIAKMIPGAWVEHGLTIKHEESRAS